MRLIYPAAFCLNMKYTVLTCHTPTPEVRAAQHSHVVSQKSASKSQCGRSHSSSSLVLMSSNRRRSKAKKSFVDEDRHLEQTGGVNSGIHVKSLPLNSVYTQSCSQEQKFIGTVGPLHSPSGRRSHS